jgi:hypothetical protein
MLIRTHRLLKAIVLITLIGSIYSFSNRRRSLSCIRSVSTPRIQPSLFRSLQASKNPLVDMFNKMGNKFKDGDNSLRDSNISSLEIPTWDEIRSMLENKQTEEERAFRSNVATGIGKASPLNLIRLFDEENKEENIRVTFYRDHASWCPYCQKVWMTLEEKRIPYRYCDGH